MSEGTRWHLPGVFVTPAGRPHSTMVTACGKRGPIRPRDDLGALPVQAVAFDFMADEDLLVCSACSVAWDEAEQAGKLLVLWVQNLKRAWRSGGAPLFIAPPFPEPVLMSVGSARYRCATLACVPRPSPADAGAHE